MSEKRLQQGVFFSKRKSKYKFYKKVKVTMTNITYQSKKINIYGIG